MKKKTLFISVSAGLLAIILPLILINGNSKETRSTAGKTKILGGRGLIARGEKHEEEGKYVEARNAYWKAIEASTDNELIKKAEERLYALNMKILFSPAITNDSLKYTIGEGDNLTKIARKFGTTVELLKKSNHLTGDLIRPGRELKVSTAKYSIMVDKSQNILMLKSNDQVLKVYRVSTGKDSSTPVGSFEVVNKLVDPTWHSSGAVISPDNPENILGSRWMGISMPGYGIHGTTQPETIGMHITAGCVRMLDDDAEEVYSIIPVGTEVTIVN